MTFFSIYIISVLHCPNSRDQRHRQVTSHGQINKELIDDTRYCLKMKKRMRTFYSWRENEETIPRLLTKTDSRRKTEK